MEFNRLREVLMSSWRKVWVDSVMVAQSLWAGYGGSRARFMAGEQGTAVVNINGSCTTGYEKKVLSCEEPSARAGAQSLMGFYACGGL